MVLLGSVRGSTVDQLLPPLSLPSVDCRGHPRASARQRGVAGTCWCDAVQLAPITAFNALITYSAVPSVARAAGRPADDEFEVVHYHQWIALDRPLQLGTRDGCGSAAAANRAARLLRSRNQTFGDEPIRIEHEMPNS